MRGLAPVLGASLLLWLMAPLMAVAAPGEAATNEHINLTFGAALAADGGRLAVGAPGDDEVGFNAGAVHVYAIDGERWVLRQRITPEHDGPYQDFGGALALAGRTLVVGAREPLADGGALAIAYVFEEVDGELEQRARWVLDEQRSLGSRDISLAIEGDTIALGAYLVTPEAPVGGGRIRVMHRQAGRWVVQADLQREAGELFGDQVELAGDWLFAQAGFGDRVVVYHRDGEGAWTPEPDLELPSASDTSARIESLAAVAGVLALAESGAPRVHIYGLEGEVWRHQEVHTFADSRLSWQYRGRLALTAGRLAYTASRHTPTGYDEHIDEVHLLRRDGDAWVEDGTVAGAPAETNVEEAFGAVLALTGDRLVAGAPEHEYPRTRAGQVYAFARAGAGWSAQQVLGPDDARVAIGCGCHSTQSGSLGFLALLLLVRRRRT